MKGKQLAILVAAVIVLGGVWYLISGSDWSQGGGSVGGKVVNFPINDVARVLIKSADGEVNLAKKADVWTVQERADYPAKFEDVSDLLRKLYELKTVQSQQAGPSQLGRLELTEPGKGSKSGTLVQLSDGKGKQLASLLLGKHLLRKSDGASMGMPGMDFGGVPTGRYVKADKAPSVSVVSDSLDSAVAKPENWLAKEFVAVDTPKSIAVAGVGEGQRWSVSRENATGEWKLTDAKGGEKIDNAKTSGLNSLLSSASLSDVLAPGTNPEAPVTTATIETFDGFRYEFSLGKEQGINIPVSVKVNGTFPKERTSGKDEKPEDKKRLDDEFASKGKKLEERLVKEKKLEGRTYLLPKSSVDALLKSRGDLLAPPPTPAPTPSPATPPSVAPVAPTSSPAAPIPATPVSPTPVVVPPVPVVRPAKPAATSISTSQTTTAPVTPAPDATPLPETSPAATPIGTAAPATTPVTVTTPPMTATPPPVKVVSPPVTVQPEPTPAETTPTPVTPQPTAPPSTSTPSQITATPEPFAPIPATPEPVAPPVPPPNSN